MTRILAFDTAGPWCAACLLDGADVTVRVDPMAKGQAEYLMGMLEDMLGQSGLDWSALDALGVGTGPGNFTGIRISVSAARGLALGLGVPAVGVTHLEAVAYGMTRPVTVVVPAPRGQAYVQAFGAETSAPTLAAPDDLRVAGELAPLDPDAVIRAIAKITAKRFGTPQPRPAPCYVRPADAAPPRDTGPKIIA